MKKRHHKTDYCQRIRCDGENDDRFVVLILEKITAILWIQRQSLSTGGFPLRVNAFTFTKGP